MRHRLVVVPHTHWDREWYRTHEEFRLRLVRLLKLLLVTAAGGVLVVRHGTGDRDALGNLLPLWSGLPTLDLPRSVLAGSPRERALVADELARCRDGAREASAEDHVVEATLDELDDLLTSL